VLTGLGDSACKLAFDECTQPKIDDTDLLGSGSKDIAWLKVAMNDPCRMRALEARCQSPDELPSLARWKHVTFERLCQIGAVEILHANIRATSKHAYIVDLDDVWMAKLEEHPGFLKESLEVAGLSALGEGRMKELEGEVLLYETIGVPEYLSKPTNPDAFPLCEMAQRG
jgi:hypothetical protein